MTRSIGSTELGQAGRLQALDGWRGISILLVLATHLLPLRLMGHLDYVTGSAGMAVFFCLSGFLISEFLHAKPHLGAFMIRRICRIVPLAWLYLVCVWVLYQPALGDMAANFLFVANLPPQRLLPAAAHFWSLCQEMQFYFVAALSFFFLRARFVYVLAFIGLVVIGLRIHDGVHASSITYYRLDEILAGCLLSAALRSPKQGEIKRWLAQVPLVVPIVLFLASCLMQAGWFNYLRAPLCALLVGATLMQPDSVLVKALGARWLVYVAGISYALYVWHPLLADTWLGQGDLITKYAKRPLLLLVLFVLAHLSTKYYERWWMDLGRKLERRTRRVEPGTSTV